jgi:ATP/maltotriose-dependent transcriptional regulator MalT
MVVGSNPSRPTISSKLYPPPFLLEILELLAKELSNKQIAEQLFIAPATVKRHTENIYQKLDVPGRHQAVGKAQELAINLS